MILLLIVLTILLFTLWLMGVFDKLVFHLVRLVPFFAYLALAAWFTLTTVASVIVIGNE